MRSSATSRILPSLVTTPSQWLTIIAQLCKTLEERVWEYRENLQYFSFFNIQRVSSHVPAFVTPLLLRILIVRLSICYGVVKVYFRLLCASFSFALSQRIAVCLSSMYFCVLFSERWCLSPENNVLDCSNPPFKINIRRMVTAFCMFLNPSTA